uniref:Ribonuclease P protein subunit p14 n=1 Tax=Lygus hesperus TaxID=30085 RepID=A0A0A9Y2Y1_LYGHE
MMGLSQFYYLDFTYSFAGENTDASHLDAITAKSLILTNLKTFFGDSAAGVGFDLLVFRPATKRGVIRCPASSFVKLRASMTLPAEFDGDIVSFRTIKASPLLTALLSDSRTYEHKNYLTAKRKLRIESYSEEEMDTDGS